MAMHPWSDGVVPSRMGGVRPPIQPLHFLIANLNPGFVELSVQLGPDPKPAVGRVLAIRVTTVS